MTTSEGGAPREGAPQTLRPAKSIKSPTMLPARRTVLALIWVLPLVVFVAFRATLAWVLAGAALLGVAR